MLMIRAGELRRFARRFVRDDRGSMTVEFVLWIPWMLLWLVFILAAFMAMDVRGDAAKATYTVADIVSRFTEPVDRNDLEDLAILQDELLPSASAGGQMRITSIQSRNGDLEVQWSECFGDIIALTDDTIPEELIPEMANLDTVILTETFTPYTPITDHFGLEAMTFGIRIATRPRFVAQIVRDPLDPGTCPTPDA